MTTEQIIKQVETLSPDEQKSLISYFILRFLNPDKNNLMQLFQYNTDFDISKYFTNENIDKSKDQLGQTKEDRKPGFLKGKFYMADDFDAPLEDFKDYM